MNYDQTLNENLDYLFKLCFNLEWACVKSFNLQNVGGLLITKRWFILCMSYVGHHICFVVKFSICVKFWKSQFDVCNLHFWIYISYLPWVICLFNLCYSICFLWFVCPIFLYMNYFSIYVKFSISLNSNLCLTLLSKLFICETFSSWWMTPTWHPLNFKFGLFFSQAL